MKRIGRALLFLGLGMIAVAALGLLSYEIAVQVTASRLPEVLSTSQFQESIWQKSVVTDRDGAVLWEAYRERRVLVTLDEVPKGLIDALLSAEDDDFYQHEGVDYRAILRALLLDTLSGRYRQGGSTITQQLARNLYLSQEKTLWRKLKETVLARKIEQTLSKNEILEQYLNTIYWGHGCYGIEQASRFYFGKPPRRLTLPECALLAGVIKSPESLSPVRHPDRARRQMVRILQKMQESSASPDVDPAADFPRIVADRAVFSQLAPYAVDAAMVEARPYLTRPLDVAGATLRTSIDASLQEDVNRGVSNYLNRFPPQLVTSREEPGNLSDCITAEGFVPPGCAVWIRLRSFDEERQGWVADVLGRLGFLPLNTLPEGQFEPLLSGLWVKAMPVSEVIIDSPWMTDEVPVAPLVQPQVAVVMLEARTGDVLALYGGIDHRLHPYNRAISARRPIGSTIKPLLLLAGMEALGWKEDTLMNASPLSLPGAGGRRWSVTDLHPLPSEVSLVDALTFSSNVVAVRTLRTLGLEAFREAWLGWGLPDVPMADLSVALGNVPMSPLELAQAYAMFAAFSTCAPKAAVLQSLSGPLGTDIPLLDHLCSRVPAPGAVRAMRSMLRSVVERGTGKAASVKGQPILGKTGTSPEGRDAWFAGILQSYVVVVWIGSDDYTPLPGNSGPETAAVLYRLVMEEALADLRLFSPETLPEGAP